ncbi:hypothetical protein Syun_018474 [Stephania yunnanensis]|uniref:Reverse transcriptase n=1 Tax=Stephania yunnanensis TaxID=152371 RepID=A0AAP0IU79_9MAGN
MQENSRAARFDNSRVKKKFFQPKEYVMRKAEISQPISVGKFSPKWEGPYKVCKKVASGAYKLETLDGKEIPQSWNISNLRKFYH